ncbi:MAG: hypothetical protein IIA07_00305 [Proteobacteria bacterium]|nr:hypothetical protein [Pseudomonadota bacterium]
MWSPTPIYERVPQVWFLLGLLFVATGLYLGFEFAQSFWYIAIGCFCCAFGVALFVLRLGERPRGSAKTRLSPDFVSEGPAQQAPAASNDDNLPVLEQSVSK